LRSTGQNIGTCGSAGQAKQADVKMGMYVWGIGTELAFRFEPNPINRSHAPFPAYPIRPARRALSSRMWRSACSGSSRRQSPCHVASTGHAGGCAMATHL
jgi:hypothetical protein